MVLPNIWREAYFISSFMTSHADLVQKRASCSFYKAATTYCTSAKITTPAFTYLQQVHNDRLKTRLSHHHNFTTEKPCINPALVHLSTKKEKTTPFPSSPQCHRRHAKSGVAPSKPLLPWRETSQGSQEIPRKCPERSFLGSW